MATLKDVANLAGVTVTTVSRMMNGRCNVSPATRARIEDAMKTLGYHPNERARGLAKKTSNDIMAAHILRYCHRHGIRIPEQLKVVGYDDTSFAQNCTLQLTTIHQPIDELANFVVMSIIRAAEGQVIPVSATFPVRLVERETT